MSDIELIYNPTCIRIKLGDEASKMAMKFAEDVYESNADEYARRGQTNKWNIIDQIYTGKMGELALWKYLVLSYDNKISIPKPNMKIYGKNQKSFSSDMCITSLKPTLNIHIKTQTYDSRKKFGHSYLMQNNDPLVKEPKSTDLIACLILVSPNLCHFFGFLKAKNALLSLPKIDSLMSTKLAMYWDDQDLEHVRYLPTAFSSFV